jgi:putative heme-binding domain-containing protein
LLGFQVAGLDMSQVRMLLHAYALLTAIAPESLAARRAEVLAQCNGLLGGIAGDLSRFGQQGTDAHLRREAARLLIELGSAAAVERTAATLLPSARQEDRLMGLFVLRSAQDGWTPQARRSYFATLNDGRRLVGGEGMPKFLTHLREDAVAGLTPAEKAGLAELIQPAAVPEPDLTPPARPIVRQWKLEDFASLLADPNRRGNAERGATVFREALCDRCHRVGARGPAVGPDLSHVAGRFGRRDLLQSVLTPSAVVAENYRSVQIALHDGRVLVGRIVVEGDFRSETLRLATNPLKPSEVVEVNKRDVRESKSSDTSPMPAGLLDAFDQDAVLDLLAFLESGAGQ